MPPKKRRIIPVLVAIAALIVVAFAGFLVVRARSGGGGAGQPVTTLPSPTPHTQATAPPAAKWLVVKARGPVAVYRQPSPSAGVRVTLPKINAHGQPTVMLVRETRVVGGLTWYNVWLASRPNGSRGWVRAKGVGTYATVAKIVIDVSARRLSVYRKGMLKGQFPVAVGSTAYPTPTGFFFVNEKVRPLPPDGPFGVLAIGLSSFQPKLPSRGSLAIHGTNDGADIGRAISDGCIRMRDADVLKVGAWVPSGSPVVIDR